LNENIRGNRGWLITSILLFIVLVVYIIMYPPGQKKAENANAADSVTVAKVNGKSISKDQLYDSLVLAGGPQTLQQLIDKELIQQEADKAKITITEEDINKELETIKKQFPSEAEFNAALAQYGMTIDDLKKDMQLNIQMKKLLEPQITITDENIKTFYDTNLEAMKTPEQVSASHILVATKEEAAAILTDLKNGADFAKTAQEKSTDTASKVAGGDLGFFPKGAMEEAFETSAFALAEGSLSEVVQTSHGFHIIKATGRKAAVTPTLDEKKEEIREQLVSEQIGTLSTTWLEEKKAAATIENTLAPAPAM
jgi:foldase protein PrsA